MKALTLLYHDVVERGAEKLSGFGSSHADQYKIDRETFSSHLDGFAEMERAVLCLSADNGSSAPELPLLLTFDDGGLSSHGHIADELERRGWRGHFLVPTDYMGQPGFMSAEQIRDLHRRGHCVGTHSCSHPPLISACSDADLRDEWERSVAILSDTVGAPVTVGSVPGGNYSARVGRAAAAAGIRHLFTSEPVVTVKHLGECRLWGRFNVDRGTGLGTVLALAQGRSGPRVSQFLAWNLKKAAKTVAGRSYPELRRRIAGRWSG